MINRFKHNKFFEFIVLFFIEYHWAYKKGIVAGMKKNDYFKGYVDGQDQVHKFYRENLFNKYKLIRKKV